MVLQFSCLEHGVSFTEHSQRLFLFGLFAGQLGDTADGAVQCVDIGCTIITMKIWEQISQTTEQSANFTTTFSFGRIVCPSA